MYRRAGGSLGSAVPAHIAAKGGRLGGLWRILQRSHAGLDVIAGAVYYVACTESVSTGSQRGLPGGSREADNIWECRRPEFRRSRDTRCRGGVENDG